MKLFPASFRKENTGNYLSKIVQILHSFTGSYEPPELDEIQRRIGTENALLFALTFSAMRSLNHATNLVHTGCDTEVNVFYVRRSTTRCRPLTSSPPAARDAPRVSRPHPTKVDDLRGKLRDTGENVRRRLRRADSYLSARSQNQCVYHGNLPRTILLSPGAEGRFRASKDVISCLHCI